MKISIVIGGTGTIGSAIVKLLKENGHQVRSITRSGEHQMDMENPESIRQFFSEIGTLDTIICTAGNASFGPLSKLTDEQINLGLTSKLLGQVNICRFGLKALNQMERLSSLEEYWLTTLGLKPVLSQWQMRVWRVLPRHLHWNCLKDKG